MNSKEVVETARNAIKEAEAVGVTSFDSKALQALFDLLEKEATVTDMTHDTTQIHVERQKAELALWIAQTEHVHAWSLEGFRQIIALGQSALKSIILINGGASVALLAFISSLATDSNATLKIPPFAGSLRFFVAGVFLAACGSATTYFSQFLYDGTKKWHHYLGIIFHVLTIVVCLAAFGTFFLGANAAYDAFLTATPS